MNRRDFIRTTAVSAAAAGLPYATTPSAGSLSYASSPARRSGAPRPNIVLIMADDMGFSDPTCFGGEIETPNVDRLSRQGRRLTHFYNAARCCPTRASLLTGLYPHQVGVGHMRADLGIPAYRGHLNDRCVTIAEILRAAGYRTAMSGKWHLGSAYDQWPNARGFERFTGLLDGASDYFNPPPNKPLIRDNEPYAPKHVGYFESSSRIDEDFYMTDFLSDWAVEYVRDFGGGDAPFFLYLAYTAPHWPIQAPEEDVRKYEGRFMEGWDVLRRRRYARLTGAGLIDERCILPDRDPRVPSWTEVEDKRQWDRRMAVYAAMIDRMDQGIGRVLNALEATGKADNTLILFLSDNGASAEAVGRDADATPGTPESYTSYLRPWAHLSDTPFRFYKHWVHEGGIATPFIAHWPGRIAPGIDHTASHVVDILPTVLEAASADYPLERRDTGVDPTGGLHAPEGYSLLPILRDASAPAGDRLRSRPLFWSHTDNHAVRHGRWKLVSSSGPQSWELYDMHSDRTETSNLAADEPARVGELAHMHQRWADRVGVLPWSEYRSIQRTLRNG